MAAYDINSEHTLGEVAKRHDPDGKLATFIDVLSKQNPLLEEGYWEEANDFTSHVFSQVLSEPDGSLTAINEFVSYETGNVKQVREELAMLESYSRIDTRLLGKVSNPEEYRQRNDKLTMRGMVKTFHNSVVYGNKTDNPKDVDGLATRYNNNTTWGDTNLILNGGNGNDCSSIYIVRWGLDGVYFAYPRDGKQFLDMQDMGPVLMQNGNTAYEAAVTHFLLQFGLVVADDRCFQRIANVETSGNNGFSANNVIKALNRLPDTDNTVIYVNRDIKTAMDQDAQNKTNVYLTIDEAWGRPTVFFQGVPVRLCEKIRSNETDVS